jgi:hypothetical protein
VLVVVGALGAGCGGGHRAPKFRSAAGWHLLSRDGELVAADVPFATLDKSLLSHRPTRSQPSRPTGR